VNEIIQHDRNIRQKMFKIGDIKTDDPNNPFKIDETMIFTKNEP